MCTTVDVCVLTYSIESQLSMQPKRTDHIFFFFCKCLYFIMAVLLICFLKHVLINLLYNLVSHLLCILTNMVSLEERASICMFAKLKKCTNTYKSLPFPAVNTRGNKTASSKNVHAVSCTIQCYDLKTCYV